MPDRAIRQTSDIQTSTPQTISSNQRKSKRHGHLSDPHPAEPAERFHLTRIGVCYMESYPTFPRPHFPLHFSPLSLSPSFCHTPRSLLFKRLSERRSILGSRREKVALICHQRVEKSSSPSGKVQIQCQWSGNITLASISNGCACLTSRKAARNPSTFSVSRLPRCSANATVKK